MEDPHLTTEDHLEDLHHIMEDNIVNRIKPHTLQRITIRHHIKPHKIIIKPHTLQWITIRIHIKLHKIIIKPHTIQLITIRHHIKHHKIIIKPHTLNHKVHILPLQIIMLQATINQIPIILQHTIQQIVTMLLYMALNHIPPLKTMDYVNQI
jgi:hypothetical protein